MMRSLVLLSALFCGVALGDSHHRPKAPKLDVSRTELKCIQSCEKPLGDCVKKCQGDSHCVADCAQQVQSCNEKCGPPPKLVQQE